MMVKPSLPPASRLPPQTMLNFKQNEIFFWHKFDGGGGRGGGGGGGVVGRGIKGLMRNLVKNIFSVVVESYVEINRKPNAAFIAIISTCSFCIL